MPKGIKGFQKGHKRFTNYTFPKGHTPWNKGLGGKGIMVAWNKGKELSIEHRQSLSKSKLGKFTGEKAGAWKGGLSPIVKLIRQSNKGVEWRQQIFLRDNFTCQKCKEVGGKLIAHHKKKFITLVREAKKYLPLFTVYEAAMMYTPLWDLDNGITLCEKCHKEIHRKI